MIKVSVIIPFYNQKLEYLKQALNSVLNQTLKDIEIICIDDGSTDNTCYEYINELNDKRIQLYKKDYLSVIDYRANKLLAVVETFDYGHGNACCFS